MAKKPTKMEILAGLNAKGEQVSQPELIASLLRTSMGDLTPAVDSKTRERILLCPHVAHAGGVWRGPMEEFAVAEEVQAAFTLPGETWSGKIKACEQCAQKADNVLRMASGMSASRKFCGAHGGTRSSK
jgi:hypothetical protein